MKPIRVGKFLREEINTTMILELRSYASNINFPITRFVTAYTNYQPQGFQYGDMLIYLSLL